MKGQRYRRGFSTHGPYISVYGSVGRRYSIAVHRNSEVERLHQNWINSTFLRLAMSTTPNDTQRPARQRSTSRTRIPSRPTTPLRPSSRTSLRNSQQASTNAQFDPISALEGQFAEFSDAMADLEANFMHLQLMHESLSRFSESFAAFLYGLNMNAFCVDFTEVCPIHDPSVRRN